MRRPSLRVWPETHRASSLQLFAIRVHTVHLLGGDVWAYTVFVYACYKCARLEEHPREPPDPSLFRRQRTTSRRKRLAVSAFLRRRRRSAGAASRPSRAHLAHQATPRRPVQTHPALFRPCLIDPDHQQSQQTALQRSKTARNGRTEAESAAAGGSRKAPAAEAIRGRVCARAASPGALRRPPYRPGSPATAHARQVRAGEGGGAGGGAAAGPRQPPPQRVARVKAPKKEPLRSAKGRSGRGWGAHASVCRPASAGCAPPTLSASGLPLSDAAHTAGRSD